MPSSKYALLKLTLRQGTVYYFPDRALTSPLPHFFVVINTDPFKRRILILAVVSSQAEKVKKRWSKLPGTYVEIACSEYSELRRNSIVDCNYVKELTLDQLVEKINSRQVKYKNDMPKHIVEKIRKGVRNSPVVEDRIKNLL